jgi:hypothetical protein
MDDLAQIRDACHGRGLRCCVNQALFEDRRELVRRAAI